MTQLNAQALMAMPYEQMVAYIKSWNRHKMEESRSWRFWRRNDQFEPEGDWRTWLVMAGRGYGKTRMGAEWVSALAAEYPGARFALVGATLNEARQVMVEGESGLLALPFAERPEWEPSLRRLTWRNGATATLFSAAEPESLRGPQHDFAWADEIAKWPNGIKAWDNLMLGLRLGQHPRIMATTTPRPVPLLRRLVLENRRLLAAAAEPPADLPLIGDTAGVRRLREIARQVAEADVDALILGETGSGKEVVANLLHHWSRRRARNFVALNCGALPESVLESELFGHEAGAFTGAVKRRVGRIEHASGGTLFLDEIESMPPALQVKLLRVLETREVEPLGTNERRRLDLRVIAATKVDLGDAEARKGLNGTTTPESQTAPTSETDSARRELDDSGFRGYLGEELRGHVGERFDEGVWDWLSARTSWRARPSRKGTPGPACTSSPMSMRLQSSRMQSKLKKQLRPMKTLKP